MGPADSDGLSRVPPYSGAGSKPLVRRVRVYHPLRHALPDVSAELLGMYRRVLHPHSDESGWFGLIRVRSPLLTESIFLSFPGGTEMFQFPPFATHTYGLSVR